MRGETKRGERLCCTTTAEEVAEPDGYVRREEDAAPGTVSWSTYIETRVTKLFLCVQLSMSTGGRKRGGGKLCWSKEGAWGMWKLSHTPVWMLSQVGIVNSCGGTAPGPVKCCQSRGCIFICMYYASKSWPWTRSVCGASCFDAYLDFFFSKKKLKVFISIYTYQSNLCWWL